ncbi:oligosaccharide flippase family protein, partial [Priestia sp. BR_2]
LMMMPITRINPILIESAYPHFVKLKDNNALLNSNYYKLQKSIAFLTFPICFMMFILAPEIVGILYGDKWSQAAIILRILSFKGMLVSLGNPINCILLTKGMPNLSFKWNVITAIGMFVFSFTGIKWGIEGVALSSLLFMILLALPADLLMRRIASEAKPKDYWYNLKKIFFINALIFIIILLFKNYLIETITQNGAITLTVSLFLSLLLYIGFYRKFEKDLYNTIGKLFMKRG